MKIEGIKNTILTKAEKAKERKKAKQAGISSFGVSDESDSIDLSDETEALSQIRSIVSKTPDVRVDQVERLIREIKRGKYKFSLEQVAEGFIREVILEKLSGKKKK